MSKCKTCTCQPFNTCTLNEQGECVYTGKLRYMESTDSVRHKLKEAIIALEKIASHDACHNCEHYYGGIGAYCKDETEHWGCRSSADWKNFTPVTPDKKIAVEALKILKGEIK